MKVVVVDRKKLGIMLMISGLMIILFFIEISFQQRLKFTSLIQNDMNSLKEYSAMNGKLTYKLPEEWSTQEKNFGGGEIVYHNGFKSKDAKIYGYVQVWQLNEDLKMFLENSKIISEKQNTFKNYSIKPVSVNGQSAYLVEYTVLNGNDIYYKGIEYYIKIKNGFIRFAFNMRENNYKEDLNMVFKTIVESSRFIDK
ncbi:hypothetical protein [Clostridium sp. JN-9]|uniref:hypothetical protein n=1 Tax=Clostridium sp. JN-9 TaxID=2507159 RepID=UPI00196B3CEF|nr:hypothetical protein [Clostridium sp. JN-9]